MDRGNIVEAGSHEALLQKAKGLYAHLWAMQDGVKVDSGVDSEGVRA
jgi:subfamily B ATP-binding cassette protein HlyB/CyaB